MKKYLLILLITLFSCSKPTDYQCEYCEGDQACYSYGVGERIVTLTADVEEYDSTFTSFDATGHARNDKVEFLYPLSKCIH